MEGEPFGAVEARHRIRAILAHGRVAFTKHARVEMQADAMGEVDVVSVLRAGQTQFPEFEKGTWRYRVQTQRFAVVVAFRSPQELAVITAWRERT